jgi:hypothetical protein
LRPPHWQLHADSVDLTDKLQIKPGQSVAVVNPPPGLALPGVLAPATAAGADAVIAFVARQDDLDSAEQAVAAARADRLAWISYPKGGRLGTDLNRDRLAAALATHGVQPVRQVSIDDTWSALRFRPADSKSAPPALRPRTRPAADGRPQERVPDRQIRRPLDRARPSMRYAA